MKKETILIGMLLITHINSSYSDQRYSYNARIQCGNSNSINNEYFYASSDIEAKNEVFRLLNNNTGYRGRGCKLVELTSDKPQPQKQESKSYEARIQCGNSSSGSMEYFYAKSDLEAENEVRRILNNNSGYKGRSCQVTELNSR